jgi:hypothetical protein
MGVATKSTARKQARIKIWMSGLKKRDFIAQGSPFGIIMGGLGDE